MVALIPGDGDIDAIIVQIEETLSKKSRKFGFSVTASCGGYKTKLSPGMNLQRMVEKAEADNVPLYCGEYGVIDLAAGEDRLRWLKDIHSVFNKYGIGRALWNYKEKDFGMQDKSFASIRDRFIEIV